MYLKCANVERNDEYKWNKEKMETANTLNVTISFSFCYKSALQKDFFLSIFIYSLVFLLSSPQRDTPDPHPSL